MLERTLHSSTTRAPLQLGTLTERVINPACCQPRTRGMDSKSVEARPVRSVSLRVCAFRRCCPHYLLEKLMLDCRAPLAPQATARKQCLLKASHAHGSPMGPCSGNFYTLYSHESEQCIEAIKPWALAHKSPSHSLVYLHVCVCVQRHARTWLFKKLCLESRPGIVQMDSSTLSPEEAQLCGSLQGRPLRVHQRISLKEAQTTLCGIRQSEGRDSGSTGQRCNDMQRMEAMHAMPCKTADSAPAIPQWSCTGERPKTKLDQNPHTKYQSLAAYLASRGSRSAVRRLVPASDEDP